MPENQTDPRIISRFPIPETQQLRVIANEFFAISLSVADLHLIIIDFSVYNHSWLDDLPPLGMIRPDLVSKPHIPLPFQVIHSAPPSRFLFFGDARLMDRFNRLALQATALLRSLMPQVEERLRQAGPGEPSVRSNFWPSMLPGIFWSAFPTESPTDRLFLIETHEHSGWGGASCHSFPRDVFEASGLALMTLFHKFGADEVVSPPSPVAQAEPVTQSQPTPEKVRRPRNQGKGAKCKAAYIEACTRNETPPTPTELSVRFKCSKSLASRAIGSLADIRNEYAKDDAKTRLGNRE